MRKEILFPLIVGIILGALIMIFGQFVTRLNVEQARLAQLEKASAQNTQTLNDVVSFINQATKANTQQAGAKTTTEKK